MTLSKKNEVGELFAKWWNIKYVGWGWRVFTGVLLKYLNVDGSRNIFEIF